MHRELWVRAWEELDEGVGDGGGGGGELTVGEEGVDVAEEGVAEEHVEACEAGSEVEFDVGGYAGCEGSGWC